MSAPAATTTMGRRLSLATMLSLLVGSIPNAVAESPEEKARGKPNRLIHEKSPYLLQHAYNPVDWHPWGDAAFKKAREENKPVFLSIGYSTCHWCHVMERESFEDEEIAKYLNEHYVCIKVDREERPDVDGVYMEAVQRMTGHGGWPLSAFLTPDGKIVYGATYFPPKQFLEVCKFIKGKWRDERKRVEEVGDHWQKLLQAQVDQELAATGISAAVADAAYEALRQTHDEQEGGFAGPPRYAPKFPRTSNLDFLLRYARRTGKTAAAAIVFNTLDHMLRGGIRDHLAGGFHRYSVDRFWRVPHFEKMLYDNALIPRTLLQAYRYGGNKAYLDVAQETLDYALRRMRDATGAFYSAEDADTEGEEGLTYVWTREEIVKRLGSERGAVFADFYGATEGGNFEGGPASVLHITMPEGEAALAKKLGKREAEVRKALADDRAKLLAVRQKRPQPFLDDKVLVEWNGLMISALAHAHQVTGGAKYLEAARKAAGFVLDTMVKDDKLYRRYRGGEVRIEGFLEDYAFFVEGLLDLYEADFDRRWLEASVRLGKAMVKLFWDEKKGGFFSTSSEHEKLIVRRKNFYDGAVPSGNSVAFRDLLRLAELTGDKELEKVNATFQKIAGALLAQSPRAYPALLCGVEYVLGNPLEIVVVGPRDDAVTKSMLREVQRRFLPGKVVVHAETSKQAEEMSSLVPLLEFKLAIGGRPTAFVCRNRVCKLPARDLATLKQQLAAAGSETGASK